MAWERGRYYVRKIKRNGRVISDYLGGGKRGRTAAARDAKQRARRQAEAARWRATRQELDDLNAQVAHCYELIELLARAALVAAGYHQHDRGEWRRRREEPTRTCW